jgi:uncharacterized protein YggU (UPF0235/DUF167 family)
MLACVRDEKYEGLSFDVQSAPPVPVSVESDRIELVAGIAVKVRVKPESDGRSYSSKDLVTLRADDSAIFEVYSAEDAREFVLVGLREGASCLEVRINRRAQECIELRVLPAVE